jgi:hypothetical protein
VLTFFQLFAVFDLPLLCCAGNSAGVGFAIPVDVVKSSVEQVWVGWSTCAATRPRVSLSEVACDEWLVALPRPAQL